jgi:hypothetical protein
MNFGRNGYRALFVLLLATTTSRCFACGTHRIHLHTYYYYFYPSFCIKANNITIFLGHKTATRVLVSELFSHSTTPLLCNKQNTSTFPLYYVALYYSVVYQWNQHLLTSSCEGGKQMNDNV